MTANASMPGAEIEPLRRFLLLAPLLTALPLTLRSTSADASQLNPKWTEITMPDQFDWKPLNAHRLGISDMVTLHGNINEPGPYVVMIRWHPGYMSAPHSYRTDRLSIVLSGTWHVNSGTDFDPANTVPVPVGSFVRRVAHTPHYDGVPANGSEPAIIALFGMGPVDMKLVDPSRPAWRHV
jgi:hypothetical protein